MTNAQRYRSQAHRCLVEARQAAKQERYDEARKLISVARYWMNREADVRIAHAERCVLHYEECNKIRRSGRP